MSRSRDDMVRQNMFHYQSEVERDVSEAEFVASRGDHEMHEQAERRLQADEENLDRYRRLMNTMYRRRNGG